MKNLNKYWTVQELAAIGVFAAASKVLTMFIAIAGGGMNPITLLLKNLIFTTLLVVMLFKVRKSGTLFLFSSVTVIISMMFMGSGITSFPSIFGAAFAGELFIIIFGGAEKKWAPIIGAAVYDIIFRIISIFLSFIMMRETPSLVIMVIPLIAIGYLGALIGLFSGIKAVKELRHAGIIRN